MSGVPQRPAAPRPEDRALLARLEAELALEAALEATGIDDLPARASGAVELLRAAGEERAVEEALAGHGAPLRALLFDAPIRGRAAPLAHHLAVFADHAVDRALALDAPADVVLARAARAWLEVGRDPAHLLQQTRAIDPGASPAAARSLADELPLRGLARCRDLALAGLAARTRVGAAAVATLHDVHEELPALELPAALAERAASFVRATIDELAMRWLLRFRDTMDELLARQWTPAEATELFTDAARSWEWLDQEPEVERHVLTALPELAWPIYRQRKMKELGEMLGPLMPLAWSLEHRVLRDREAERLDRELPYVAPCAQALVFWAEVPREIDVALPRIERAYALCPTLRNARVVLAHVLCDRAEHTLAKREIFPAHPPREDVERAARVFPELSRLPALKSRVGIGT